MFRAMNRLFIAGERLLNESNTATGGPKNGHVNRNDDDPDLDRK
jgi:hypothetical protein